MKELCCSVVRDLLPAYEEELTSPETNELIQVHLECCPECAALLEESKTPLSLPVEPPAGSERKIVRGMRLKFLWYLGWPLFYLICLQFGRGGEAAGLMFIALVAIMVIPSYSTLELAFDDEKRHEYYRNQSQVVEQGGISFVKRIFFVALPILMTLLCWFVSVAIAHYR